MSILKQTLLFFLLPVSLLSLFLLFLLPTSTTTNHHYQKNHHHFSVSRPLSVPFPPPPRIAYFITGSKNDGPRIFRLLQAVYHPRNYYLLHLDQYAAERQRDQLANMVAKVPVFAAAGNVHVVKKSNPVNQEGSSPLALVLHGAAILLRWKNDWDWFVNLAASDYPLIPQDDFLHILSFLPRDLNFIERENSTSMKEHQQTMDIIVDSRLYLQTAGRMFMGDRKRTLPDTFRFLTGSPHVILNHNFVEFVILGWENFPRTLLLYFSNTRFSHKAYFQTLACNLEDFSGTVINSNLRFNECDAACTDCHQNMGSSFNGMVESGAAFAGNFHVNDPVLDMIDSVVLNRGRGRGMVAPGAWCLGKSWFGRDSCSQWGDIDILRPGPTARRFEKLLLKLIRNTTFQSRLDDH